MTERKSSNNPFVKLFSLPLSRYPLILIIRAIATAIRLLLSEISNSHQFSWFRYTLLVVIGYDFHVHNFTYKPCPIPVDNFHINQRLHNTYIARSNGTVFSIKRLYILRKTLKTQLSSNQVVGGSNPSGRAI